MPDIQEDAWNRFPSPIQNKPSDIDRRPVYPRFAKVVLERRVRLKKRTSSLFWCHFQLFTCGGRRLQLDPSDLAAQSRPDSGKKRHRRHPRPRPREGIYVSRRSMKRNQPSQNLLVQQLICKRYEGATTVLNNAYPEIAPIIERGAFGPTSFA